MLKFFGRLRQKLIDKGNMKSYLVYAIGEILLVMMGILLALQVNNWNENRKNRTEEAKALVNLKNEFEVNHKDFVRIFKLKQKAEHDLRKYLDILTDKTLSVEEKAKIERGSTGAMTWDVFNAVLNSLQNTGNIENLENDSLKRLLNGWNLHVGAYKELENKYVNINEELIGYEQVQIPNKLYDQADYTIFQESYLNHSESEILKYREQIVNEIEYHNLLINSVNLLYAQLAHAIDVKREYEHIIKLLNDEIEKN